MAESMLRELEAINRIVQILKPLQPNERERTLTWIKDYFSHQAEEVNPASNSYPVVTPQEPTQVTKPSAQSDDQITVQSESISTADFQEDSESSIESDYDVEYEEFRNFSEFYEYIAPKTGRQKIATAAWWLEDENGHQPWKTYDVTKLLKSIGKPLRYISSIIAQERKREDPLVEPAAQTDDTHSYGLFRVTEFGKVYVEAKLDE